MIIIVLIINNNNPAFFLQKTICGTNHKKSSGKKTQKDFPIKAKNENQIPAMLSIKSILGKVVKEDNPEYAIKPR